MDIQEAQEFREDLNEDKEDESDSNDEELYVKVDKPWIPRPWKTDNTEEIIKEIEFSEVPPTRPLVKMQFLKKRKEFGTPYKLSDKDANEPPLEIRQIPDPSYSSYIKKKTLEIGLQAANATREFGAQTTWFRKVNTITETLNEDLAIETEDDDKALISLIKNYEIMNELESALQQNEMVDIFKDDFAVLPQEELNASEATKLTHDIVELKSVSYHTITGKRVSCIRVMPKISDNSPRFACVCYRDNLSFDEKMELFTRSMKYTMLLWDIDDVSALQPVLEIQSPLEITTFEFHPKNYNMLIAGATNGQLVRWDLEKGIRESGILNKKGKNAKQESDHVPVVRPYRYSALQSVTDPGALSNTGIGEVKKLVSSHKSGICSIQWISKEWEVEKRGLHHTIPNKSNGEQYQFVTLSEDGQVLIWDLRFPPEKEVSQGDYQWKAMFAVQLFRPDGMMGGSQLVFQRGTEYPMLLGTSDDGELYTFDWTQKSTEENPKVDFVTGIWQHERNSRPCSGLEISPFFSDIVLTLHDYHFCIWKLDTDFPIFTSSLIENAHITCGCFSPTRPGVIVIGRSDGYLDFWDLTDQSHTYIMHHLVVSVGIATLQFQTETPKKDTLNVGDNEGSLRVFVLPQNLSKSTANEKEIMKQFFEREVKRVEYFKGRFELRKDEAAAKKPLDEDDHHHEDEKKVDNVEEEEEKLEKEYQSFVTQWIEEVIEGKPPKQKEDKK